MTSEVSSASHPPLTISIPEDHDDEEDDDFIECTFPVGPNEDERIAMLRSFNILDTEPSEAFDRLTSIVKRVFDVPFALISFVDSERQWFKSNIGIAAPETHRNLAFCGHAILPTAPDVFVVLDSHLDDRFKDNALVLGGPYLRFYAGAPIKINTADGRVLNLGTICALDRKPRENFDVKDKQLLIDLAAMVSNELEQHRHSRNRVSEESQRYITCTSHELKTPLTVMRMANAAFKEHFQLRIDDLQKRTLGNEKSGHLKQETREAQDMLEVVDQTELSCEMMDQMISNAIDSARKKWQGNQGLVSDFKPVKLREVVELTERLSSRHHSEPVSFEMDFNPNVPTSIMSDSHLLRRCLVNLVSNAFKHAPSTQSITPRASISGNRPSIKVFWEHVGGDNRKSRDSVARVRVRVEVITRKTKKRARDDVRIDFIGEDEEIVEEKVVRIEVHDTGRGVPQELQSRIFNESFVHLSQGEGERPADFTNRQGSGLGLFVSSICAHELGGTIGFRSKSGVCSQGHELENIDKQLPSPSLGCVFWIEFPFHPIDVSSPLVFTKTVSTIYNEDDLKMDISSSSAPSHNVSGLMSGDMDESFEQVVKKQRISPNDLQSPSLSSIDSSHFVSSLDGRFSESLLPPVDSISEPLGSPPAIMKTVLIVDDSAMIQKLLSKNLSKLGYNVDTALNGKVALEKMMDKQYFLVFMDFLMPVLDGISATAMFREWESAQLSTSNTTADAADSDVAGENRHHQPIMGMSANADESDVKAAKEAGIDFFHTKPVKMKDFERVIERVTSESQLGS